jgi:hypothetical protein
MTTVTIDTNILPGEDLLSAAAGLDLDFAAVSVTGREAENTDLEAALVELRIISETGVWGESRYGEAVYGPGVTSYRWEEARVFGRLVAAHDTAAFEAILQIVGGGAFPRNRESLSKGHHRQLRDAMIFYAHVREKRDIFVTNDERGFIKDGRREALQNAFGMRIMTQNEFIAYCNKLRA